MDTIQKAIIESLGLVDLPSDEQEEFLESIGAVIYEGVLMRAAERLTDTERIELDILVDDNADPEKLFTFLESKIRDLPVIIKEEVVNYKKEVDLVTSAMKENDKEDASL